MNPMSNSINEKTRGFKPFSMENFSTSYSYNAVGAPLTLKRQGVIAPASEDDSTGVQYGLMDNLSYQWDGMLLASVSAQACGSEFYGRTGYSLSANGGTGSYKWNGAGLLNADSARGIRKTYYNESGQPTSIEFTDKGHLDYTYSTSGARTAGSAHHPDGPLKPLCGRRATLVSERCYCGGFVFEGDSLIYANIPGGYFDGEGHAHYSHTDFQGNITMVTDRDGQICQHTGYYPYGEPWPRTAGSAHHPDGMLKPLCGRDGSLNDYDFSARRLNSALALWTAPDPMARDFSNINPYVYCASNPIRYTDPTGKSLNLSGDAILQLMMQLTDAITGINLSIDFKTGDVTYLENGEKMNDYAKTLKNIIDDKDIFVKITAQNSNYLENGDFFIGGAFMGNEYDKETNTVTAFQTVNPDVLNKMSSVRGKPGQDIMHEISEAYEGGKIALNNKTSYPESGDSNPIYPTAHTLAIPQSCTIFSYPLINGNFNYFSTTYSTGISVYYVNSYNFNGEKPSIQSFIILTMLHSLNRLKPATKKLW